MKSIWFGVWFDCILLIRMFYTTHIISIINKSIYLFPSKAGQSNGDVPQNGANGGDGLRPRMIQLSDDEPMKINEEMGTWLTLNRTSDIVDLSDEDTIKRKKQVMFWASLLSQVVKEFNHVKKPLAQIRF